MSAKVVDASIVAAWCFRETRASEAMAILQDSELHAPLLLAYELTSIARRKAIAYPEKSEVVEEALQMVFAVPIYWSEVDHLAVLRLALDAELTTYDACYLYLARKLGMPLVTFDQQLARASLTS
ncbi:MAG: type II toxin-antitoxin system VapC family toxin [Chloroflexi bacterium]|nr:type II toxin-antitoxin system VapC family toxin [Chloroflexota bacterium]MBM3182455.1 type II toxin-antitoxin system VapC family toxin [Chloroflexota bacterium]MBM4451822.1 type II toxin-antitoxin system VapC family toxin [Chloroflexota bacterium]MBM4453257.1 type II toxin-antitoxin system VapC family toxin [Chloroflexota bacterium]